MISIQQAKPFTNSKYEPNKSLPNREKGKKSLVDIISSGTRKIWDKKVPDTQMDRLKSLIQDKYRVKFDTYWDFHEWSVQNYAQFWEEIWNFYGVIHSQPYTVPATKVGDRIIDIKWFPGAKLNYAENLLRHRDDQVALICVDEDGEEEQVTYAQMYEQVKLYTAAFKKHGLQTGDRLACYMSNRKEAIFAMLAATSIGALFGGPLPFYGAKAVSTIMQIMKPKFLLAVDRFTFNKEDHNILQNLPEIVTGNEGIEKVIIVPTRKDSRLKEINHINNAIFLEEFLECGRNPNGEVPDLEFEQFPFDHPIYINFTSGTTGLPKGLVHSAGTFLAVLRDYGLHCDLKRGDVILSMQPVGWNLWNLAVNFLAMGGTLLVYDGLPAFLTKTSFWDIMDLYKVAFAFLPTSIVDTLEKENMVPASDCKLEHLKILSIGASPVKLQNVDFIQQKVKPDLLVGCLYGATEVIGVFSGFDLNTPVYSSQIQCPALGVDLKIFDTEGATEVIGVFSGFDLNTPVYSSQIQCPALGVDLKIFDTEGATEVIGVFSGFDLNTPVYSSQIQCPALGVDLKIFDTEGATEVIGVFSGFDLNTPVYSSQIQCPALGVDLKIFDTEGATEVIGVFSGFDLNTPVYSSQIQCPALGVDLKIFDTEGATEVIGVFSGFDLNTPVYSSQIQCPALGVDLKIFDTEGNSVVGKSGELVIATPTLSMPVCVWNDENESKMHETYLSKYPGVWTQNDEAWIDPTTKGLIIIGRSDNTIKQYGDRFVSEEIYWAIHDIEEIADSICVGQYNGEGDGRAVLFVKMKNGHIFDDTILKKIENTILEELTVFYIPQVILPVKDIPYNLNGKKMESLVKKIINTNTNTVPPVNNVRNPECLSEYCNLPQLQQF